MSNKFGSMVVGYFLIGAAIGVTQLGLSTVFEPPCTGVVEHTLWKHYEVTASSDSPSGQGSLIQFGLGAARWLPDLYNELLVGDMSFRDYLLGGYHCTQSVTISPEIPAPITNKPQSDSSLLGRYDRPAGSLAEALLKEATQVPDSLLVPPHPQKEP